MIVTLPYTDKLLEDQMLMSFLKLSSHSMKFFSLSSFRSYVKYTPNAFIGSLGHLMPSGFALFSFDEPIHIPSVFVLLILRREMFLKRSNT